MKKFKTEGEYQNAKDSLQLRFLALIAGALCVLVVRDEPNGETSAILQEKYDELCWDLKELTS